MPRPCAVSLVSALTAGARASAPPAVNPNPSQWGGREVVGPELAPRLRLQATANPKFDNFVDDACQLGAKTTVAAGCMLGRGTTLGDKCSVKRSVLGHLCKVGSGVRCGRACHY